MPVRYSLPDGFLFVKGNIVQITIKLYGQLRRYRPKDLPGAAHHPFTLEAATGATAVAVADQLGIPDGLVNAAAVNDEAVANDVILQDGDQLTLFPPSAGG